MDCFLIYGPTASGKFSIGSLLSKHRDAIFLHNHLTVDLCKTLFKWRSKSYGRLVSSIRLLILEEAFLNGEHDIVLTWFYWADKHDKEFTNQLCDLINMYGVTLHCIGLNPNIKTLENRVLSKNRSVYGKPNSLEQLHAAIDGWKFKTLNLGRSMVIDNSAMAPEDVVRIIMKGI